MTFLAPFSPSDKWWRNLICYLSPSLPSFQFNPLPPFYLFQSEALKVSQLFFVCVCAFVCSSSTLVQLFCIVDSTITRLSEFVEYYTITYYIRIFGYRNVEYKTWGNEFSSSDIWGKAWKIA